MFCSSSLLGIININLLSSFWIVGIIEKLFSKDSNEQSKSTILLFNYLGNFETYKYLNKNWILEFAYRFGETNINSFNSELYFNL